MRVVFSIGEGFVVRIHQGKGYRYMCYMCCIDIEHLEVNLGLYVLIDVECVQCVTVTVSGD